MRIGTSETYYTLILIPNAIHVYLHNTMGRILLHVKRRLWVLMYYFFSNIYEAELNIDKKGQI